MQVALLSPGTSPQACPDRRRLSARRRYACGFAVATTSLRSRASLSCSTVTVAKERRAECQRWRLTRTRCPGAMVWRAARPRRYAIRRQRFATDVRRQRFAP